MRSSHHVEIQHPVHIGLFVLFVFAFLVALPGYAAYLCGLHIGFDWRIALLMPAIAYAGMESLFRIRKRGGKEVTHFLVFEHREWLARGAALMVLGMYALGSRELPLPVALLLIVPALISTGYGLWRAPLYGWTQWPHYT